MTHNVSLPGDAFGAAARTPRAGSAKSWRGYDATMMFCVVVAIVAVVASVFQLVIGANFLVVVASLGIIAITLVPVRLYGLGHFIGAFFAFMCFYWGMNSLAVKSLTLQKLDSYLYSPVLSYTIVFVSVAGSAVGAMIVNSLLRILPKLAWPTPPPRVLRLVTIFSVVIGVAGVAMARLGGALQAIAVFFSSYIILAFAAECVRMMLVTDRKRALSPFGLALGLGTVLLSVASNSKFGVLLVPVAYVVVVLAYGGRFKVAHFVVGALGAIFLSSYVFPAISYIARANRDTLSPSEMLATTASSIGGLIVGDEATRQQIEARNARATLGRDAGTRYDVPYVKHAPLFFERFMLVPYVDAVARRMNFEGPYAGAGFIVQRFSNLLPKFINANKVEEYSGHEILTDLRLSQPGFKGFPTIGLPGEVFYAGGTLFAFFASMAVFGVFSIVIGVLVGRIHENLFGVFLFVRYSHLLISGLSMNYGFFIFRQLPVDIVLFLVVIVVARYGAGSQEGPSVFLKRGRGL